MVWKRNFLGAEVTATEHGFAAEDAGLGKELLGEIVESALVAGVYEEPVSAVHAGGADVFGVVVCGTAGLDTDTALDAMEKPHLFCRFVLAVFAQATQVVRHEPHGAMADAESTIHAWVVDIVSQLSLGLKKYRVRLLGDGNL